MSVKLIEFFGYIQFIFKFPEVFHVVKMYRTFPVFPDLWSPRNHGNEVNVQHFPVKIDLWRSADVHLNVVVF